MAMITFDVRFDDGTGGQTVDADLRVEIFEEGSDHPAVIRYIGADVNSSILVSTDTNGTLYATTVDGSQFQKGELVAKWYAKSSGSQVDPYPFIESQTNVFVSNGELTAGDIKGYIRNSLGFPAVSVELTGTQYGQIIEETLQLYGQHCPQEKIKKIDYSPTTVKYNCPEIPYTGPFDVKFVRKVVTPIATDPIFGREYLRSNQPDLGTLIMGEAYLDTALRVLSSEPDWRWLHNDKDLYINIGPGVSPQVYGGFDVSVRWFEAVDLPKVPQDHHRWFKRYCLALSKGILSQIRGKFSGMVPAPGQSLQLNSGQMSQEAISEAEALKEELRQMQMHIPPTFG